MQWTTQPAVNRHELIAQSVIFGAQQLQQLTQNYVTLKRVADAWIG
jgi:hypothetical protein